MLLECIPLIAEITGFFGAARRIVLGIEINHYPLADQVGEAHWLAVLVGQAELRGGIADLQGHGAGITLPRA
jgi:hypothetical protein